MANYINYISDDELTDWVLDYLKAVNWQNANIRSIESFKDSVVERDEEGSALITLYFDEDIKVVLSDEYIQQYMEDFNFEQQRMALEFGVNSFDVTSCGINGDDIFKTVYGGEDLHEDFRKYWCDKMFHAVRNINGEEFLQDLNQYNSQLASGEENEQLENQLQIFNEHDEAEMQ